MSTLRDKARALSDRELLETLREAFQGSEAQMPLKELTDREKSLDSPAFLATEILDPWYKEHFEPLHYSLMDEVMAPWILGETARIEGVNYDPTQYTGIVILWSRGTIKSTTLRMMVLWDALYKKIREGIDARTAYIHQVDKKAMAHGEAIKAICRLNPKFRECFPEFVPKRGSKEWDTKQEWRYPCFTDYQANEFSFTAYGETSSKTGGHYFLRAVDDWVTEESVTTPDQLDASERRFRSMDNLRDRTRPYNPWIVVGTHYHYSDTYKRLEDGRGWFVWKVPGHTGSPKAIFDLLTVSDRSEAGRRKIEKGLVKLEEERSEDLNFPKILPWRELYRSMTSQASHDEGGLGGRHQEYNCQILLNPVPAGEHRFDHVALEDSWVDEIPGPRDLFLYIRVDPAISQRKTADEVAINMAGVDWQGTRWYIDGWVGREKRPTEIVRKCFRMARRWQGLKYVVKSIGVESVAYQEALAQLCRDGVPEREATEQGELVSVMLPTCQIISIPRSSDMRKTERILMTTGPVSRHETRVWKRNPIGRRLIQDHKEFPYGPLDLLDTCHDMYLKTHKPARRVGANLVEIHPLFLKLLKSSMLEKGEEPFTEGMSNSVKLSNWRN